MVLVELEVVSWVEDRALEGWAEDFLLSEMILILKKFILHIFLYRTTF